MCSCVRPVCVYVVHVSVRVDGSILCDDYVNSIILCTSYMRYGVLRICVSEGGAERTE